MARHSDGKFTSIIIDFSRMRCCHLSLKAEAASSEQYVLSEAVWWQCCDGNSCNERCELCRRYRTHKSFVLGGVLS